jgi:protein SCO1/2
MTLVRFTFAIPVAFAVVLAATRTCNVQADEPPQRPHVDADKISFSSRTVWFEAHERHELRELDTPVTTQAGQATTLRELIDRPTAITFFYTRCTNGQKCCSAIGRLATLNRRLHDQGTKARLIGITFEPQHDTPNALRQYGERMGVEFSNDMLMLQVLQTRQQRLVDALNIPVSYQDGWVSLHGVALLVLDKFGRVARRYHTVLWENEDVFRDLARLTSEE